MANGGVQYTVNFLNKSTNPGSACVYQEDPNLGVENVMSLAWFSMYAFPTTSILFQWTIDYSFVWGQTGQLVPGVQFNAAQTWSADLSNTNQVTLDYLSNAYTFENQTKGPAPGSLTVSETAAVPLKQASVGIGMSGAGTFVVQAQPNLSLKFTPHPRYWITFGTFRQGQVLDITQITGAQEIDFPPGVYSMAAILNADNSWTIQPTSVMNDRLVDARRRNAGALWGAQ